MHLVVRAWWITRSRFCFLAIAATSLAANPVDLVETCIHTVSRMDTFSVPIPWNPQHNSCETLGVCLIYIRAFRFRAGYRDPACLHLLAKGFAGRILVLIAVLHSSWTVVVLDQNTPWAHLMGNDVAVTEDFCIDWP